MKKTENQIARKAKETLLIEKESIGGLMKSVDADFISAVQKIYSSKGRTVITGIGKSGIIAQKIVATLNSTGTPSLFMHAADAIHGDLGMIQKEDIIICISKSGESPEIKILVPLIKGSKNFLIGMVGNKKSFLAKNADLVIDTTVAKEACPNNLAPTSSTTAQLAMGDALAVCLLDLRGFSTNDFARFHPGGALGKQLYLKVDDLLLHHEKPMVKLNDKLEKIISEMTSKRLGATAVVDEKQNLLGIITDGDLRRMMQRDVLLVGRPTTVAKDLMNTKPKTIQRGELAIKALEIIRQNNISQIVITNGKKFEGLVHIHDLLREGLV